MPGTCPDCGHSTVACDCDIPWGAKGFTIHESVTATRTKRRYYDSSALDSQLGGTSKERREKMEHDTQGLGYAKEVNGRLHHRNRKTKEVEPVRDKDLERVYLGGDTEV